MSSTSTTSQGGGFYPHRNGITNFANFLFSRATSLLLSAAVTTVSFHVSECVDPIGRHPKQMWNLAGMLKRQKMDSALWNSGICRIPNAGNHRIESEFLSRQ